jgi:hypothetical protein
MTGPTHCFRDLGEPVRQVIAWTAVESHPLAILAGDDAETVQLDLVQPDVTGRRLRGFDRKAGRYEPDWEDTRRGHGSQT